MARFKIAITGPESTGKSTLTKQLATHFSTAYSEEYARKFIDNLGRPYVYEDLLLIAKGQKNFQEKVSKKTNGLFFSDTSLMTIEIWSMDKFGKCDPWIASEIKKERFDLYLMCDIDTSWEADQQREDPNRRTELYDMYVSYIHKHNFTYEVVSGLGSGRLQSAIEAVNKHLRN